LVNQDTMHEHEMMHIEDLWVLNHAAWANKKK